MENIYLDTSFLDENIVKTCNLSHDILIENAAAALESCIDKYASPNSFIIIVVGSGNNGVDGLTLARRIIGKYNVKIYMPKDNTSYLGKNQLDILKKLEAVFIDKLYPCDIVVDCLFGTGFKGHMDSFHADIITIMNKIARVNIACDIPSGIDSNGTIFDVAFRADVTICMGALKLSYFSDCVKDYIGDIVTANLGVSRSSYEFDDSKYKLLTRDDFSPPVRLSKNCHKGDFGHCCIIAGQKEGASILSALSAFSFGSGLVSVIGDVSNLPYHIMNAQLLPEKCTSVALGMGLGDRIHRYNFDFLGQIPSVIDADMFYNHDLSYILRKGNMVLTPHIKEFASLLNIVGIGNFEINYILSNRIKLVEEFSHAYPDVVLILKGANTIIAENGKLFINVLGSNNLSKAGSGDVLSGMVASLLSQGHQPIDAAINAVLGHSIASLKVDTSYGLEPLDLIEQIKNL